MVVLKEWRIKLIHQSKNIIIASILSPRRGKGSSDKVIVSLFYFSNKGCNVSISIDVQRRITM